MTARKHAGCVSALLIGCLLLVGAWELTAWWVNRGAPPALTITATTFAGFQPALPGAQCRRMPVVASEQEPNLLAFQVQAAVVPGGGMEWGGLFRLAHGYNMPDCMRIKGYTVEELGRGPGGVQLWRLQSVTGDRSLWVTSVLAGGTRRPLPMDVRDIPFPRVGIPDELNWSPRGFSLRALRHPVANLRKFFRARWNASRCDTLTFLGLRRPVWVSDEVLTAITAMEADEGDAAEVPATALRVHEAMLQALAAAVSPAPGTGRTD